MFLPKFRLAEPTALAWFVLVAVLVCQLTYAWRLAAQEPARPEAKRAKVNELLNERLATVREMSRLASQRFKHNEGSVDQVREANRMLLEAELDLCNFDKDRIVVLENFVVEAKRLENTAANLAKSGQGQENRWLAAKADRLQAEIALERVKAQATPRPMTGAGQPAQLVNDQLALAEKQLAIRRAMVKVAEAQKMQVIAKIATLKAHGDVARAQESFAAKQFKRIAELANLKSVGQELVDERALQWEAAKARRRTADGDIAERESELAVEEARVELAQLEFEEAALRLKQLKILAPTQR